MGRIETTGEKIKNGVVSLALIVVLLAVAFACLFVIFEQDRTEKALSRAKHMRVEITTDEAMLDSFSDTISRFFARSTAKFKSWTKELIGSDSDDVAAQLQTVDIGAAQPSSEDFDLSSGI